MVNSVTQQIILNIKLALLLIANLGIQLKVINQKDVMLLSQKQMTGQVILILLK